MSNILVIGDIIVDKYVHGTVNRICPEAPVPVLEYDNEEYNPGGAANVAANLAAFGNRVCLIGVAGEDSGEEEVGIYQIDGMKNVTSHIVRDPDRITTLKTRMVSDGKILLRVDNETTHAISTDTENKLVQYIKQNISIADVVVISDYGKGVITPNICRLIGAFARCPILIDPHPANMKHYPSAHTITPNKKQAEAMGINVDNDKSVYQADIVPMRNIVVTMGRDGAKLFRYGDIPLHIELSEEVSVADVSGAGDVFIATYAHILAHLDQLFSGEISKRTIAHVISISCAVATISVNYVGTWIVDKASTGTVNKWIEELYDTRSESRRRTIYGDCSLPQM